MDAHVPVMLAETIETFAQNIAERDGMTFVDATLGGGGHTEALLESFPLCRVIAFDQDRMARDAASSRLARFGGRLRVVAQNFRYIADEIGGDDICGALFDLGVSNMQLTEASRGFSFQHDGPIDMRMDESAERSALDLLDELNVDEMTAIFRDCGEERYAYRIARGIVDAREAGELPRSTAGLVALIRDILPAPVQRKMGGHPARRVFQALRIAVNDELGALQEGLDGAISVANDGAVIAAISYHSLEDRIVKRTFKRWSDEGRGSILTKRPLAPSGEERDRNPRSRSAKFRAFKVQRSTGGEGDKG